jgi:NAD+ kinase
LSIQTRKIGVLAHPLRPQTFPLAHEITQELATLGIETWVYTEWDASSIQGDIPGSDLVFAIGGDGSMLRVARVCAPFEVPVMGVNMGQLGFLTEITDPTRWSEHLTRILAKDWWVERRMMLSVSVLRNGEIITKDHALNDGVISGDMFGRLMEFETEIDGHWTTTYFADALVTATATGSTAYALAIGGPILPPELKNILIVPAAPHLSMDRPIVLSEGSVVVVRPSSRAEMVVNVDGRIMCELQPGDEVRIQASEDVAQFARLRSRNYFYRSLLDRLEPRIRRGDKYDQRDRSDQRD